MCEIATKKTLVALSRMGFGSIRLLVDHTTSYLSSYCCLLASHTCRHDRRFVLTPQVDSASCRCAFLPTAQLALVSEHPCHSHCSCRAHLYMSISSHHILYSVSSVKCVTCLMTVCYPYCTILNFQGQSWDCTYLTIRKDKC